MHHVLVYYFIDLQGEQTCTCISEVSTSSVTVIVITVTVTILVDVILVTPIIVVVIKLYRKKRYVNCFAIVMCCGSVLCYSYYLTGKG